jgi:MFS-type transporter involved in bile tolerance (Atg22 family)
MVGLAMALPFLISSLLIPFVGLIVDKKGKRVTALIIASFIGIITYVMFITLDPIFPLISLGLAYSIFCSVIWPSFSMIIPKDLIVRFFSFYL